MLDAIGSLISAIDHLNTWMGVESERVRGKVDRTPEGLYVGTEFWCLLGVPVVPQRAKIYTDESSTRDLDREIPHCWKSIIAAYARSLLWAGAIASTSVALLSSGLALIGVPSVTYGVALLAWGVAALLSLLGLTTNRLWAVASTKHADQIRIQLQTGIPPQKGHGFAVVSQPQHDPHRAESERARTPSRGR